jgi:beta-galactosidase
MGNGPGNINEYVSAFYKYPKLQGGFAWEWANHGLLTEDSETGETFYAFGGDFGDIPNDSTFVMDGLVDSRHKPTPGLKEYKKAIEPVQLLEVSDGKARFISRYDFITLDHLSCEININCESGLTLKKETDDVPPGIGPGGIFEILLEAVPRDQGEVILNVSLQLKEATPYLEAGFEVANAQIQLNPSAMVNRPASANTDIQITTPSRSTLNIRTKTSCWVFNTLYGTLTSWVKDETELVSKAPTISIFRAQTDNDIPQDGRDWTDKLLHLAKPSTRKVEWSQPSSSEFRITVHQRVAPPVLSWTIDCILTYQFHANGSLIMHVSGTPKGENLPRTLPRIGLVMEMPKQFHHVQWWGRGPGESYRDSKLSQQVGMYNATVDELWMDYEVPQESSNRTDTRWLRIFPTSADSATTEHPDLFIQFSDGQGEERALFDFQASHYSMQDVSEARHPHELWRKKKEEMLLRLDWAHHGLGSGSCGPRTLDQYGLLTEPFEFEILLQ